MPPAADLLTARLLTEAAYLYRAMPGPTIGTVTDTLVSGAVPQWELLELSFPVTTIALNYYLPYTASPPAGQTLVGITVDAQFSKDGFATWETMPAFWYENFTEQVKGGHDWLHPLGTGTWKVRWTPSSQGIWQYRLVATDASGSCTPTDPVTFTAGAPTGHGPIRPRVADPRLLEYSDGTPYFPQGYNLNATRLNYGEDPTQFAAPMFATMGTNKIAMARIWSKQLGLFSANEMSWFGFGQGSGRTRIHHGTDASFTAENDNEMGFWVESGWTGLWMGWGGIKRTPACKRSTTYRMRIRYRIPSALNGPLFGGDPWGFVGKFIPAATSFPPGTKTYHSTTIFNAEDPNVGTAVTPRVTASTGSSYADLVGTFTTGSTQDYLDPPILVVENGAHPAPQPNIHVLGVWIEEDLGGGNYGPNICSRGGAHFGSPLVSHGSFTSAYSLDQKYARYLDLIVQSARDNGIWLNIVTAEQADDFISGMDGSGALTTPDYGGGQFFGLAGSRQRWLQQAQDRVHHARYGWTHPLYEATNETNPGTTGAASAYSERAAALKAFANAPLLTDSLSVGANAGDINGRSPLDVVSIHVYQDETTDYSAPVKSGSPLIFPAADWADSAAWTHDFNAILSATNPTYGFGKPMIKGEGEIVSAGLDGYTNKFFTPTDDGGIYTHKKIWQGAVDPGAVIDLMGWHPEETIYRSSAPVFDRRPMFKIAADWRAAVAPNINNGHYVDAGATAADSNLRVTGQKDLTNKRGHLWIDNKTHTWKRVVDSASATAASGTVAVPGMPAGTYDVSWYDTYAGAVSATGTATSDGTTMTLTLPAPTSTDLAVSFSFSSGGGGGGGGGVETGFTGIPGTALSYPGNMVPGVVPVAGGGSGQTRPRRLSIGIGIGL